MRIAAQFRSKERLERLKMGAQPLPKLANTTLGTLRLGRMQAQVSNLREFEKNCEKRRKTEEISDKKG